MTKNLKTSPLGDRLVSCGNMYECSPGMEARQRRYRCWCPSCAGRAEQPVSADHWHINASLGRALSQAKRAGFLWRQRAREQQRSLFWLKQGAVQKARAVQKALDILLELDVRLVCEASGQGFFMRGQPRLFVAADAL